MDNARWDDDWPPFELAGNMGQLSHPSRPLYLEQLALPPLTPLPDEELAFMRPSPGAIPKPHSGEIAADEAARVVKIWRPRSVPPLRLPEAYSPGMALSDLVATVGARVSVGDCDAIDVTATTDFSRELTFGDAYIYDQPAALLLLSHLIEDTLIERRLDAEVLVGFQRLSRFSAQRTRYERLLETARWVCVFGLDDEREAVTPSPLAHRHLLRFPIEPRAGTWLEWFWFIVVDHPQFHTALVAQQVTGTLWAPVQRDRKYAGFWTGNPALTKRIARTLRKAGRVLYMSHRM